MTSATTGGSSANPALRNASTAQPISVSPANMVPLSAFATFSERSVPTSVWHDGGELSSTLSFNLADGVSLEQGRAAVLQAESDIGMPNNVRGAFAGAAAAAQQTESQQTVLIVAAIVVIYIVLGILYESLIHPLTVLTTLPSAGFGAVFALLAMLRSVRDAILARGHRFAEHHAHEHGDDCGHEPVEHDGHSPHGSGVGPCTQLSDRARMRADEVLPPPRGPENR